MAGTMCHLSPRCVYVCLCLYVCVCMCVCARAHVARTCACLVAMHVDEARQVLFFFRSRWVWAVGEFAPSGISDVFDVACAAFSQPACPTPWYSFLHTPAISLTTWCAHPPPPRRDLGCPTFSPRRRQRATSTGTRISTRQRVAIRRWPILISHFPSYRR